MTKIKSSEISNLTGTTSLKLHLAEGAEVQVQPFSLRVFSKGLSYSEEKIPASEVAIRKMLGESPSYDIVKASQAGWVLLSREGPSTIVEMNSLELYAATTAFLAAEKTVIVEPYEITNEKIQANCEAGAYWQRYKNPKRHKFYLGFDGGVITIDIEPGESLTVFHGYWLAMEGGLKMKAVGEDVEINNPTQVAKKLFVRAYNRPH